MKYKHTTPAEEYDHPTINNLPQGWVLKPLAYLAKSENYSFVDGPFGSDLKSEEYQDEGVPLIQLNNIKVGNHVLQNMKYITTEKRNQLKRHIALSNDIVIAKMADPVARAALVSDTYPEYVIVADCVKLSVDESLANPDFIVYAINSKEVNSVAELESTGTTRVRINLTALKKLAIPYPPVTSQSQIATFLDRETAKIDRLIEKQQRLIELLEEKRQAVISHAVTKGLNPNAPMKESGVEWLGEVPEHWDVVPIKHLCSLLKDGTHLPPPRVDEGIPLLSVRNIQNGRFAFRDDDSKISVEDHNQLCRSFVPKQGDVLLAIVGATLGKVALIGEMSNFQIQRSLAIFRTKDNMILSNTLSLVLASSGFQSLLWEYTGFSAQPGIYLGTLANFSVPVPPIDEQKTIVRYCEEKCDKLARLIAKASTAIDLMLERRTSLISAAVTGKIDVRDQVPQDVEEAVAS